MMCPLRKISILLPGGNLKIGEKTTISSNVFITNIDHDYERLDVHIMQQKLTYRETQIGKNCFIGHGAVIMAGARLGKQCIVGANSVVRRGVYPDYCVLAGIPAKIVKYYNAQKEEWSQYKE